MLLKNKHLRALTAEERAQKEWEQKQREYQSEMQQLSGSGDDTREKMLQVMGQLGR